MASLTPTVVVAGNTVTLILLNSAAILPGSDTGSFTGNQGTIANMLNQAGTTLTGGDLNTVLNVLSTLTPAQLAPILDSLERPELLRLQLGRDAGHPALHEQLPGPGGRRWRCRRITARACRAAAPTRR